MMELVPSFAKTRGIYLKKCYQHNGNNFISLYPLDQSPHLWSSCHDAYDITWKQDPQHLLEGLSIKNRLKLAYSMGFCPHLRCQLGNVTNGDYEGHCPAGLCYTKLENGSPSFGACCFINGSFIAGNLIGYFNKSQNAPKPIYKHSRVILNPISLYDSNDHENSYERFINANYLIKNPSFRLIATQCPMKATLSDVRSMIFQESITLWIQLTSEKQLFSLKNKKYDCLLLPNAFSSSEVELLEETVEEKDQFQRFGEAFRFVKFRFNLSSESSLDPVPSPVIHHIWYKGWEDFAAPSPKDHDGLHYISSLAANHLLNGGNIAINCFSGRGRSGTLSALVMGKYHQIRSHNELVDLIVSMRENRDGLVEIPSQYLFVSQLLFLPSLSLFPQIENDDVSQKVTHRSEYLNSGTINSFSSSNSEVLPSFQNSVYLFSLIVLLLFPVLLFMSRKTRI
jgi:protein tyrosine phosphatase